MFGIYRYESNDDNFFKWLETEFSNSVDTARPNMWDINWIKKKNTLPYILENTDRFFKNNGAFFILTENDQIVGCSGVYKSSFCKDISIAGSRMWITKTHRNKSLARDYLLPAQKSWAQSQNSKQIALTFNEYNKNLIESFKRIRLGENSNRLFKREPHHIFYNGLVEIKFPIELQHVRQWVIYEPLDLNWQWDWNQIKWTRELINIELCF